MKISHKARVLVGCLLMIAAIPLIAVDRIIAIYGVDPRTDPPSTRELVATPAFRSYINSGGTFTIGVDRLLIQYYDAGNIQEIFDVSLINGQWYVSASGYIGRWASPQLQIGGGGGPCGGYPTTIIEQGYWSSWTVCLNGSCSSGSTWIHEGFRVYPEAVYEEACYGYIV